MSTLAKQEVRAACCDRLDRIDPNSAPRWGRMAAHQMICHLTDSFKGVIGEKTVSAAPVAMPTLMKWLALHTAMPWPHNVRTRPEMEQGIGGTPPSDWEEDRRRLREWILSFHLRREFVAHPMFGPMSWEDWQIWGFRHVDHHLRQFGV